MSVTACCATSLERASALLKLSPLISLAHSARFLGSSAFFPFDSSSKESRDFLPYSSILCINFEMQSSPGKDFSKQEKQHHVSPCQRTIEKIGSSTIAKATAAYIILVLIRLVSLESCIAKHCTN